MTKLKFGTTNIVIEKGTLNGAPVDNMTVDIHGLYLIDTATKEAPSKIFIAPETATLDRDSNNQVFTIKSTSPVAFRHSDLVALEVETEVFEEDVYVCTVRVINTMMGQGVATINVIADNGDTAEFKVTIARGY